MHFFKEICAVEVNNAKCAPLCHHSSTYIDVGMHNKAICCEAYVCYKWNLK